MLNFVIYEDEEKFREIYKNVIHSFFAKNNNAYKVYEFDRYDEYTIDKIKKINGKKIYLLDIEVPGKNGIEFAREIRKSGDWLSQLIVITSYEDLRIDGFMGRILMLDFISKFSNIQKNLKSAIITAYDILLSERHINVKQNGEIHKILYNEILYIEKNLNNNYVTIFTKTDQLSMKCSINSFQSFLEDDPRFMKIHRSCIVNICNIKSYDTANNSINFGNKTINLIARHKKKELKEKLLEFSGL